MATCKNVSARGRLRRSEAHLWAFTHTSDAMHTRGLCCHAVSVSVTFVSCVKTNKDIFEIFPPYRVAKPFQFFRAKQDGDIPTGTPVIGASNAGGMAKNAILNEYRCIHCIQVYSIVNRTQRSVKNKGANVDYCSRCPSANCQYVKIEKVTWLKVGLLHYDVILKNSWHRPHATIVYAMLMMLYLPFTVFNAFVNKKW